MRDEQKLISRLNRAKVWMEPTIELPFSYLARMSSNLLGLRYDAPPPGVRVYRSTGKTFHRRGETINLPNRNLSGGIPPNKIRLSPMTTRRGAAHTRRDASTRADPARNQDYGGPGVRPKKIRVRILVRILENTVAIPALFEAPPRDGGGSNTAARHTPPPPRDSIKSR